MAALFWKWTAVGFSGDCFAPAPPEVNLQAHSAPLGMGFYTGNMFPAAYRNDAFVALHGSWNQSVATGYKIVRIIASSGRATDRISAGQ